ncbi:MAG: hypothetical protein KKA19_00405, partial [Candidatus Margulisbacteria bacterium]|nr:hypothetical protein [Candidatus Margulisiibacteriota bacterium]
IWRTMQTNIILSTQATNINPLENAVTATDAKIVLKEKIIISFNYSKELKKVFKNEDLTAIANFIKEFYSQIKNDNAINTQVFFDLDDNKVIKKIKEVTPNVLAISDQTKENKDIKNDYESKRYVIRINNILNNIITAYLVSMEKSDTVLAVNDTNYQKAAGDIINSIKTGIGNSVSEEEKVKGKESIAEVDAKKEVQKLWKEYLLSGKYELKEKIWNATYKYENVALYLAELVNTINMDEIKKTKIGNYLESIVIMSMDQYVDQVFFPFLRTINVETLNEVITFEKHNSLIKERYRSIGIRSPELKALYFKIFGKEFSLSEPE